VTRVRASGCWNGKALVRPLWAETCVRQRARCNLSGRYSSNSPVIVNMPRPVMAAALFVNGALMFVVGAQIVASRPITLRASFVVGFSILMALTVPVHADFYKSLPEWAHQFTGSIGKEAQPATAASFDAFFAKQAKEWKISAEDAARVRSVVDTAIEDVALNANGPVDIQLGTDSFNILVTVRYVGNLPPLPDLRPKREMLEAGMRSIAAN
jgi:hypothetical protein